MNYNTINPLVVGMVGRKRTGKDTFCELVRAKIPDTVRIAFADEVKRELSVATGVSVNQIEEQKDRFRGGLQWWGTEFRRYNDDTYWIKKAEAKLRWHAYCSCFVITDVRFQDEADWVKRQGGVLVKLTRTDGKKIDHHISEIGVDRIACDYEVINPMTTIPEFRRACSAVLTFIVNSVQSRALPKQTRDDSCSR